MGILVPEDILVTLEAFVLAAVISEFVQGVWKNIQHLYWRVAGWLCILSHFSSPAWVLRCSPGFGSG